MPDRKTSSTEQKLAIEGGEPVRTSPLPLEFPGVHHMDEEEVEAVVRVLRSRSLFRYYGIEPQKQVEQFEADFAQFVGVKHALAVGSGTGALHVALAALGIGPGREVIVPAYLWVAVAAAVVNNGAIPVLADIDDTFCLDPSKLGQYISNKTAGIILIHMSGAAGNAPAVKEIAREKGLFLLEDCAQCAGGTIEGRSVGTFGDMAIFSFQMNKNMTAGEGGCVVTNDPRLFKRAFACHDLGYARDESGRLDFDDPALCLWGRGYRLDELRAAVLRVQLRKLPTIVQRMRSSKYRIREALAEFPQVQLRRIVDPGRGHGVLSHHELSGCGGGRPGEFGAAGGGDRHLATGDLQHSHDAVGTSPVLQHPEPGSEDQHRRPRFSVESARKRGAGRSLRERQLPGGGRSLREEHAASDSLMPQRAGRG